MFCLAASVALACWVFTGVAHAAPSEIDGEPRLAVGFQVDLFPTVVSAVNGELGYAPQLWFGMDHLRLSCQQGDYVNRAPGAAAFAYPWLYPISEPSKRWPDAIAQAGIHAVAKTPIENTREAVGESAIDWLGKDEADELLLIDDLVILPRRLVFDPKGEIAR